MFTDRLQTAIAKAKHDVQRLQDIQEFTINPNSKQGRMRGHYAGGYYFFYKNGEELFRSTETQRTIEWLSTKYFELS